VALELQSATCRPRTTTQKQLIYKIVGVSLYLDPRVTIPRASTACRAVIPCPSSRQVACPSLTARGASYSRSLEVIHGGISHSYYLSSPEAFVGMADLESHVTIQKRAHYAPPWADVSIIGIAGSSGSGKSTLSQAIVRKLNLPWVVILSMVGCIIPK
jgi:ABC-type multidrug transport system fused ATPase/permease subunit